MSDSRPTLRLATADDAAFVAALHTLSWQLTYRHALPDDYLREAVPEVHRHRWQAFFADESGARGVVMLAEHDGAPVGFACAVRTDDAERGVLLDNLHVHPDHHGHGTGAHLLEAVRDWARQAGEHTVHLFVLEDNLRAIRFYERNGWRRVATESSHIGTIPVMAHVYVIAA